MSAPMLKRWWLGLDGKWRARGEASAVATSTPVASFRTTVQGTAVSFDGTGSSDTGSALSSWAWDFGDGSTGTGATTTHTYPPSSGTYVVTLTVTDLLNSSASTRNSVAITVGVPKPQFTFTTVYLAAQFDGTASTDSGGSLTTYTWAYGDGATGSGLKSTHTYAAAGSYTATLTVQDSTGQTAAISHPVPVAPQPANIPPTASFSLTISGATASVNGSASSDPDGTVKAYAWDWGDSTPAGSGVTASHTYAASGTYTITLTVTDDRSGTGTVTKQATVSTVVGPVQPTGAGIVQYQSLSGATLGDKLRTSTAQVSFPTGTFQMVNFAELIDATKPANTTGNGADNNTVAGVLGSGSGYTTFQLQANSSTKTAPTSGTNNMQTLQFRNRTNLKLQGFTVAYTTQRDIANGMAIRGSSAPTLQDIKTVGFKGNSQSPPGETFHVNLNSITNGATITNCEADGSGQAASLFATNTFTGTMNVNGLYVHDTYSATHKAAQGACKGFAMWQHTGTSNWHNFKSRNNWAAVGFERVSGVHNFYNPDFDSSNKLFGHLGNQGYSSPCKINFYFDSAALVPAGGLPFWIPSSYEGLTNQQSLSDITVYVNGVVTSGIAKSVAYPN